MRVALFTKEYPPFIYGGAGVHVAELTKALRLLPDTHVDVHCFGSARDESAVTGYDTSDEFAEANAAVQTLMTNMKMVAGTDQPDLTHSHTWYANTAGHHAALLHGVPHVMTAHSLEPLRPWKAEQLGGGYALSSHAEKTAVESATRVIAVSDAMRGDILRCYPAVDPGRVVTVRNGIDPDLWKSDPAGTDTAEFYQTYGLSPDQPLVVFVGRITRQKGLPYFLDAVNELPSEAQVFLAAGAPDTPEIHAEVADQIKTLQVTRQGIVWEERHLPHAEVVAAVSAADVFVCPSVYEPLGIVNLEAMACETAVVATATGGIPEVVVDGQTGWLVPIEQVNDGSGRPLDPAKFTQDLAETLTNALSDVDECARRGQAGRQRVIDNFTWNHIADQTIKVYREALSHKSGN